jgi:hypothetical protein
MPAAIGRNADINIPGLRGEAMPDCTRRTLRNLAGKPPHFFGSTRTLRPANDYAAMEASMDERTTLRVLAWSIGAVIAVIFVLNAVALAAI